ncbi:MAG: 16S rRNA (cytidine(1402)-2'-O)-methyltransferase [Roseburia sp.]|nr:16S rRNA (cytidine(1402)-2'-O)-methyltransferase [Anaeroplasma bactoclasticum]MCM1196439.1 16S rRNA (cytidine(1402)-2'-O)-methyltransferase [Roseburia sp.]MCM1557590.1 16S rRNA (cytidine(1402)-2'-O)-methyltransferase [Anaeroplasma bactoclasticum]
MKIRSFDADKAILYLVATPIGNLKDMTFRAIEVLKNVDKIYAEDTRTSHVLLSHYDIHTKLESYHEYNQDLKIDQVLKELKSGMKLAIISDAGLPVISDPGYKLVQHAIENEIAVSTIPGASAGISALIASGLAPMPYTFYGFLDAKHTKRIKELEDLKYLPHTIIFYEAPHRIEEALKDMLSIFGNRKIVLARELTKTFEEYARGTIEEILLELPTKGEMVLIVEGYKEKNQIDNPFQKIDELISLGSKPNDAIKEVAKLIHSNRSELYNGYLKYKNKE